MVQLRTCATVRSTFGLGHGGQGLRYKLPMADEKILFPALCRTETSSVGRARPFLVPLVKDEDGVRDTGAGFAHLDDEAPSVRLALSSAAYLAQKFHGGTFPSEELYRCAHAIPASPKKSVTYERKTAALQQLVSPVHSGEYSLMETLPLNSTYSTSERFRCSGAATMDVVLRNTSRSCVLSP